MKKWWIGGGVLVLLVVAVLFWQSGGEDVDLNLDENVEGSVSEGSGVVSGGQTFEVEIIGFEFVPGTLDVSVGDSVVWTNRDLARHTATSEDWGMSGIDSGLLSRGESYSYTFEEVGEYDYYCVPHPYMKGKVVVS